MAIATLSVDLVARLAKFEGDLGKAARASEQTAQRINAAFGTVGAVLGTLGAGISVAGIVAIAKASIDGVDRLNDLKDATGASIENLSALEDVAARTGTSMDTVSASVTKFNKALADAKPDSDAARALEAIGLSAKELKALDPAEALLKTAVALQGFADDGNKARLTQELFGKSLKEVAPFLKDLAEKGQLVATVTTAQALEAEKFNKELFALQKNAADAARSLTGPLVSGLNDLIAKYREATKSGLSFNEFLTNRFRESNGQAIPAGSTGGATGDFGPGAGGGRGSVNPDFVRPSVGDLLSAGKKTGGAKTRAEEITDAQRALSGYVESLSRTLEKNEELTATEKALNFLRTQGVQGQVPQVRELVLGLAAQVDMEKELAERLKTKRQLAIEAGDAVAKSNEEYQALLGRLLAATPTSKLVEQRKDVEVLTAEFEAGRISEQLYLEAVSARLDLATTGIKDLTVATYDWNQELNSGLEDAILKGKSFTDVLGNMAEEYLKLSVRDAIKTSSIGTGISGFLGNLFSFDGGGSTGGGPRSGGLDGRGGFMAMLHPQETVVDHTRSGGSSGGGAIVVHINQTVGDVATVAMLHKNNQALVRQIQAGIGRSQNYGGALA